MTGPKHRLTPLAATIAEESPRRILIGAGRNGADCSSLAIDPTLWPSGTPFSEGVFRGRSVGSANRTVGLGGHGHPGSSQPYPLLCSTGRMPMRFGRCLPIGAAGLLVACLTVVATPASAAADECEPGYTFDQTGQCVPAPQQGQDTGTSGTNAPTVLPPDLSANACGDGYEFDQSGTCVSTSAPPTDAPAATDSTEDPFGTFPGSQGSPGPGDVYWLPGFGESSCPGGCEG